MAERDDLVPAGALAAKSRSSFPNESTEYRTARTELLAEEIELRRHIEQVAAHRRALPPGGEVTREYCFDGADGPVTFAELFGDHDTLVVYSFMYGPQRAEGCPMCTSQMSSWDGDAPDIEQHVAFAMVARSPIERILDWGRQRGWLHLNLYSDPSSDYTRDYVSRDDADMPGYNVFTRRDGAIRHFWSGEGGPETADPGQDPHDAPDMSPLWTILDTTPEGRGTDWYPTIDYPGVVRAR
jgi:predicted dithiol-disulfide oxidoreductase (DUF899 family)